MLVFYKPRLVFLSIPKTGTTAYEKAYSVVADHVISNPPALKHAPLYRYNRFIRPMYEKVCGTELQVMAVVREPISWLGSWYRYRQRPSMRGDPKATFDVSFDEFVMAYSKGKPPPFADVGSQARFLAPQANGTRVTYLFAYENQALIQAFLKDRVGVLPDIGRENTSPEMALSLSKEVEDRLRRKCAAEFELYDSVRPKGLSV
ncbi:gamma-glutamyl kinase [Roseobacter sp. EG26]|uniref:gamma-glutamyl kinase n=1 Tax=Roseobacter sp. EG26 TaxID=3412477 RepID=UPI003CE59575